MVSQTSRTGGMALVSLFLTTIIISLTWQPSFGSGWPVWPDSTWHPISATYGVWQYDEVYGGDAFMHSGVDFIVPPATPVYAINSGYVKAFITVDPSVDPSAMWRVVIGDNQGTGNCNAYMYAHLDYFTVFTIAGIRVGDYVEEGQFIGETVDFTTPGVFDHLHVSIIEFQGDSAQWANGFNDWIYAANPLDSIAPMDDIDSPVIENALGSQLLAFNKQGTIAYFGEGEPVSGDVDIVSRIYDYDYFNFWKICPYEISYKIQGDSSISWTPSICFTKRFGTYDSMSVLTHVIYQKDPICNSIFIWDSVQEFYFNLTNHDDDSLIELSDIAGCWQTPYFRNGDYKVFVKAIDKAGNSAVDSMTVTVANYFELGGTIGLSDANPDLAGTVVTALENGATDTTASDGTFSIPNVGGASQAIQVTRSGYYTKDTTVLMIDNNILNLELEVKPYICGDVNADQAVNLIDILYLIDYKYGTPPGPAPQPEESGDVNHDGAINLIDILYLIDYKYGTPPGPAPDCG